MATAALVTPHLDLVPFDPSHLLVLIEAPERFAAVFGHHAADGLRDFFVSGEVSPAWTARLRSSTTDPWVFGFAIVHRASAQVIGSAGFKGTPDADGVVEIAYAIVPEFTGRGHATQAAAALVAFASADPRVRCIRAHTLPGASASTSVLRKAGFTHTGQVEDPEDGIVWRWERAPDARGAT